MDAVLWCGRSDDTDYRPDRAILMAQSLTSASRARVESRRPILLLEEAVHLLRRAPAAVWTWHIAGSFPLALGTLFFWNAITNPRTSSAAAAAGSLGMSLMLVWMNYCRALFARRLKVLMSGAPDLPWTGARVGRLLASQSLLAASKLIVLPIAILVIFPLAHVAAVYRYTAAFEGPRAFARARKLAGLESSQGWVLLLLLQFLVVVVAINVALALAILPHLLRILTGYDSAFTRSGVYYILNPLFAMLVAAVTWMIFDPFVQAVYTLRSFYLESLETGEDLRVALRRIRAALTLAAAVCILMLTAAAPGLHAAISRERLEESIQQAVQAPEYDWRLPPKPAAAGKTWLVETVDRMLAQVRSVSESISNAIARAIRWLVRQ